MNTVFNIATSFPGFFLLLLTLFLPVFTIRFETDGYVWTWEFSNLDINVADSLIPGYVWRGLDERLDGLLSSEPLLSGIQAYDQAPQSAYPSQVHQCKVYK